ncbi:hypothetical protein P9112_012743 [Eukaryota sp. TZLM1-RC]
MHLDCVWNVISDKLCIILDSIVGEDSPRRRMVDVYVQSEGGYKLEREDVEFSHFLIEEGYELLYVTDEEQANYGCNHLNLGNSNLVCVNQSVARKIARHPSFNGKISLLDFTSIQSCYGSTHCASQCLKRSSRYL